MAGSIPLMSVLGHLHTPAVHIVFAFWAVSRRPNTTVILSEREPSLRGERESKDPGNVGPAETATGILTKNSVTSAPLRPLP